MTKKYLVWAPNTPRDEPFVVYADSWSWHSNDGGGGSRTTFSVGSKKVGIVVGDCVVLEGVDK